MRRLLGAAAAVLLWMSGCSDLFHSTDFADGLIDPDAGLTREQSIRAASLACAHISGCLGPLGNNRYGDCVLFAAEALVEGSAPFVVDKTIRERWKCLLNARTCDDTRFCVLGNEAAPRCEASTGGGAFSSCRENIRVHCTEGKEALAENCAMWGQVCKDGACVAESGCPTSFSTSCAAQVATTCSRYRDRGRRCDLFGATCVLDSERADCSPKTANCEASGQVRCRAGETGLFAESCRGGHTDFFDCSSVGVSCNPLTFGDDPRHASSGCYKASGSACTAEVCDGQDLVPCIGAHQSDKIRCSDLGFSTCATVKVPLAGGASFETARCVP